MRPLYDLASVFAAQLAVAADEATRINDAMIGLVTDNKDPKRLGRVKCRFPVLSEQDASDWAPIVMLGAGKNRGWFFIPEVNDEVLVIFEQGDPNRPIVVGALWNGKDKPPDKNPGGNPRRTIKSRAGSKIIFDDEKNLFIIEDGTTKGRITFDANANTMLIEALEGDVCLQAPLGEIQIVCKSAELTAKKNVEIHAGGAMQWGTDASAKLDGGPAVTLSGSTVNLNCGAAKDPPAPTANPTEVSDPYEARGPGTDGQQAPKAAPLPHHAAPTEPASRAAPASAGGSRAGGGESLPPLEPKPVLVSAAWEQPRAKVSTRVKLSAVCTDMTGKPATFTIRDADDDSAVIATIRGTCGKDSVAATWTTPASGPPGQFVFEVSADGKQATSGVLSLIHSVKAKLVLDDEPAEGVRVVLRAEPSGVEVTAEADEKGEALFDDAPFGEYTLRLDE